MEVQEEKKKIVVLCSRSPQNVKLGTVLSSRSRATTAKECTNKRDAHAKLLFCSSKRVLKFPVLVAVAVVRRVA